MTNNQAVAYAILALDCEGIPKNKIREIEMTIFAFMDMRTEEEAERLARFIMAG